MIDEKNAQRDYTDCPAARRRSSRSLRLIMYS
jgi:hypothetical protein